MFILYIMPTNTQILKEEEVEIKDVLDIKEKSNKDENKLI